MCFMLRLSKTLSSKAFNAAIYRNKTCSNKGVEMSERRKMSLDILLRLLYIIVEFYLKYNYYQLCIKCLNRKEWNPNRTKNNNSSETIVKKTE